MAEGANPRAVTAAPSFVVGLGASAGGIEALSRFVQHVPRDSGAAYVVVLHLSPDYESKLAEVLQRSTPLPVAQVTGRVTLARNHVYVVPPNGVLSLDKESIVAEPLTRPEQRRSPVDLFFRSLADSHGSAAVAVVLSGTGPNGSAGLKRIKEYGGLIVVQEPGDAEYEEMPRNALRTGLVDLVLPAAAMPERIVHYQRRARTEEQRDAADAPIPEVDALRDILAVLRIRTGHDFSQYKPGTLLRRIQRRINIRSLPSITAYAQAVRENPDESIALMKELLVSVTSFFRDPDAFQVLADRVLPRLFVNRGPQDQIRVWVPACATGEEAYSIAILLAEHAAAAVEQPAIQMFATDLDERAIAQARDAFYTDAEAADVPEERLKRFFAREAGGYRIRRELREMVLFAHHNVTRDPPFSHLDLISCRNFLIYLNRSVQERVLETFHFALKPGGYLFLGASESPDDSSDLFTVTDKNARIYESRSVASRPPMPLREHSMVVPRPPARPADTRPAERLSSGDLHLQLLERYGPPSLVVTEEHSVVHMSYKVGRYLQIPGGEPTRDLFKLLRADLRPDLRTALHQAIGDRTSVAVKGIAAMLDDGAHRIDVTVHPVLRDTDPSRGYVLITFEETDAAPAEDEPRRPATPPGPLVQQLEEELARVKQQLLTTIEQHETQVEEAKAANEELQAMNEELRSAAEELETSKEELQSVNEELTTVNQELKVKVEELGVTNNDFQNLIHASDAGVIFLDRDLRVKLSTPAANQIFNLRKSDVGRPLSDITSQLLYEALHDDVQHVLEDLRTINREVQTRDGRWTFTRIRPYRTVDNRIDGVVITFHDVTDRRRAEDRLRQGEERLRLLIDGATDYAIFTMSTEGVIDSWNAGAQRMFGYDADEIIGRHVEVLFTPEDRDEGVPARELAEALATGRGLDERFHIRKNGSRFYCSGITTRLGDGQGLGKIARDLSAQQQATAAHRQVTELLRRLFTAQEDERARIARDLHDQLGQQLTALRLGLQRHRDTIGPYAGEDLDRTLTLADRLNDDLDFLARELRPALLDDLGLSAALPLFIREWSEHYRVPAEYHGSSYRPGQLGRDAEVVFYRVVQEALTNIAKHAHASRVDVMLEARPGAVVLIVEDDGVGFDPAEQAGTVKGIGLAGMQERARLIDATLEIESAPGEGTSIFLRCASPAVPEPV